HIPVDNRRRSWNQSSEFSTSAGCLFPAQSLARLRNCPASPSPFIGITHRCFVIEPFSCKQPLTSGTTLCRLRGSSNSGCSDHKFTTVRLWNFCCTASNLLFTAFYGA